MTRSAVDGPGVVGAQGGYSPGVRIGDLVQTAGQGPIDPRTGAVVPGSVAEQVELTLANVAAVLAAAGGGLDDALMVRVYLTSADHFAEMDEVYRRVLSEPYPARTTVFVGLGEGMLVEIDALAVIPDRS